VAAYSPVIGLMRVFQLFWLGLPPPGQAERAGGLLLVLSAGSAAQRAKYRLPRSRPAAFARQLPGSFPSPVDLAGFVFACHHKSCLYDDAK
jgi:hypothetical protein